jgi:hypothetical protein
VVVVIILFDGENISFEARLVILNEYMCICCCINQISYRMHSAKIKDHRYCYRKCLIRTWKEVTEVILCLCYLVVDKNVE